MHSPPIDFLARAPKPQKTTHTETESDGRFSELLRGPSKADAKQSDVSAKSTSEQPAVTDDPAANAGGMATEADVPVETETLPANSENPATTDVSLTPQAIVPVTVATIEPHTVPAFVGKSQAPQSQAGIPPVPASNSGETMVAPSAVPAASGAPLPTGPAEGAMPNPQPHSAPAVAANPALPANPVHSGTLTAPANPGATATMTPSTPPADMQTATAGPVIADGRTIAGGGIAGETTPAVTPAATAPKADQVDAATLDRVMTGAPPTPERPAMTRSRPTPMAEPVTSPEAADATQIRELKSGSQPMRTLPTTAANSAAPAATPSTGDKSGAAVLQAVPSTVSEIAEAPLPTGQAEPNAAAAPGQFGRMVSATTPALQVAQSPTAAQPAAEQVVLQLQRAVREGVDRLTVQLKPASLGRVDVQMDVGHDGRVQAIVSAERPETLHLLQRDARALAEALNDAGLQSDSGSLSFNLRGQSGDHAGGDGRASSDGAPAESSNTADDIDQAATQITLTLGDGRVDIKV